MKTLLSAVVSATLAMCTIEAHADATPGQREVVLKIESSSLATALDKWAQQSGFQIFFDEEITRNLIAPSVIRNSPTSGSVKRRCPFARDRRRPCRRHCNGRAWRDSRRPQ
jgi:hypothetical protein